MGDTTERFPDLPILDELGDALMAAYLREKRAGRRRRRWPALSVARPRSPGRALVVAGLLVLLVAASSAAATLFVLRGSPIPAPSPRDVPPEQTPVPASARLAPQRAADPGGGPPWALRIARSRTGFLCSTVGQVVGGQFGLVGLDRRFRTLAAGIVDGCGQERHNAASLVGARVFDAHHGRDVRTVVNGVAGPQLRRVIVEAGGVRRDVPVSAGGVFVTALRGYPEDLGIRVALSFADGHVERHPFGVSDSVVPDPTGGRAWRVEAFQFGRAIPARCARPGRHHACPPPGGPTEVCVRFRPARQTRNPPFSEAVCGRFADPRRRSGYFFGVRREVPGPAFVPGDFYAAGWKHHPPRTAVFGIAGEDVTRVDVDGPGGRRHVVIAPGGAFVSVYGPDVRPADLAVRVTLRGGRVETHRGDTNLVTPRRRP
jgi:hypothetical protein